MSGDRERWNERHAAALAAGRANGPPSAWLLEHAGVVAAQPRGRALDVACGLGRNALHLAAMGFRVLALDVSDVAVEHVARRARERGLAVEARRVDLGRGALPPGPFEVVVVACFLDRRLLGPLARALAPGGLLLYDTFLADATATCGPRDPAHVLRPGELSAAFAGLERLDLREGAPAPGERARARLLARRRDGLPVCVPDT